MNKKQFIQQFVAAWLASWSAREWDRGNHETGHNPPVEDAEFLACAAWKKCEELLEWKDEE